MFPLTETKGGNWELNVISLRLYSTLRSLGNVKKRVDPKTLSSNAEDLRDESCGRSTEESKESSPLYCGSLCYRAAYRQVSVGV